MCEVKQSFTIRGRIRSFTFALAGIVELIRTQHNAWIHLSATVLVIGAGVFFNVSTSEWCFLVFAMVLVWVAEALNTAFEYLSDVVSPASHPLIKKSKDIAAGAVLINAIGAVIVGLIIFVPYIKILM